MPLSADKENLTTVDWNVKLSSTLPLIIVFSLYSRVRTYSLDWVVKRSVFHHEVMRLPKRVPRLNPFPV